jgi:hypothetical protein
MMSNMFAAWPRFTNDLLVSGFDFIADSDGASATVVCTVWLSITDGVAKVVATRK